MFFVGEIWESGRKETFLEQAKLPQLLERTAAQFSERPALATGEGEYSYSELYDSVGPIRRVLIAPTTDPDPLIGVMTGDDIGTYASILAILAAGAGYVPISRTYPASRISQILDQAGIRR
ncbi:MAG: AMP-binding protein, partial [Thermoanaerobaculia bacterium]